MGHLLINCTDCQPISFETATARENRHMIGTAESIQKIECVFLVFFILNSTDLANSFLRYHGGGGYDSRSAWGGGGYSNGYSAAAATSGMSGSRGYSNGGGGMLQR
jgi:hypothetical protein